MIANPLIYYIPPQIHADFIGIVQLSFNFPVIDTLTM